MDRLFIRRLDYYIGNACIAFIKPFVFLLGKILRIDHRPYLKKDLTVIKFLGGGSLIVAYPCLLGLRKQFPAIKLRLVTADTTAPFAESMNIFDEILPVNSKNIFTIFLSELNIYRKILFTDTVVDLEVYSRLSTFLSTLTLARNRIGFYLEDAFWRKDLSTHLVYFNRAYGMYHFYEKLFSLFGIKPAAIEECRDRIGAVQRIQDLRWALVLGFWQGAQDDRRPMGEGIWSAVDP